MDGQPRTPASPCCCLVVLARSRGHPRADSTRHPRTRCERLAVYLRRKQMKLVFGIARRGDRIFVLYFAMPVFVAYSLGIWIFPE